MQRYSWNSLARICVDCAVCWKITVVILTRFLTFNVKNNLDETQNVIGSYHMFGILEMALEMCQRVRRN